MGVESAFSADLLVTVRMCCFIFRPPCSLCANAASTRVSLLIYCLLAFQEVLEVNPKFPFQSQLTKQSKVNNLDRNINSKHANFCARRCLWDQKPRSFDSERVAILCNFSELVARELEASAVLQWKQTVSRTLKRAMDCYHQAYLFVDVSVEGWQVMHANQAFCDRTGECSSGPCMHKYV